LTRSRSLTLSASSVGGTAASLLDGGRVGRVEGVYSRALNVLFGHRMLCLVRPDVGRSPINVVLDVGEGASLDSVGVSPGMEARAEGGALVIGGGAVTVKLPPPSDAPVPRPRRLRVRRARSNLRLLKREVLTHGNLAGLRGILSASGPARRPTARTAPNPLGQMVRAFEARDLAPISGAARRLIGLGPGLTPAADDLLSGLMMSNLLTSRALGLADGFAERANERVLSEAEGRTTRLSREFLAQASKGSGGEHAEGLLDAVLFGGPEDVGHAARSLFRFGATSGTDTALGILLGAGAALAAGGRGA